MNPSKPFSHPLQLPIALIVLAAAAALIAGVQWLHRRLRASKNQPPTAEASVEFAERFGLRGRLPHRA